ncbi:hypothetical protein BK826_06405 [Rothia kristinae]|uniref:Uncharacterized protein n=1 Tax=Rothia kristinae TaxID=37923 RepID=A0A1S2MZE5_9MICC|nr:hypothetical protein [Rothia kristinae]OIJ35670.1 hypothetical protein BK826_06405 [Rothia kristinae]
MHSIPKILIREYGSQFVVTSLIFLGVLLGIPQERSQNWTLVLIVIGLVVGLIRLPRALADAKDPEVERAKYSSRRMILWRALVPFLFVTAWIAAAFIVSRTAETYRFSIFGNVTLMIIVLAIMAVFSAVSYRAGMRRMEDMAADGDRSSAA